MHHGVLAFAYACVDYESTFTIGTVEASGVREKEVKGQVEGCWRAFRRKGVRFEPDRANMSGWKSSPERDRDGSS